MRPPVSRVRRPVLGGLVVVSVLAAAACGDDDTDEAASGGPTVVATTSIWADVVANLACDGSAQVETLIAAGVDPHAFEPSLQDRERLAGAALVVANGLALEEGLVDTLEAVAGDGTPVFEIAPLIPEPIMAGEHGHDDHSDEGHAEGEAHSEEEGHSHSDEAHSDEAHSDEAHSEMVEGEAHSDEAHSEMVEGEAHSDEAHSDEAHSDEDGHSHEGEDPHVWHDPARVAAVLPALADALVADAGLDAAAVDECLATYVAELEALDAELADAYATIPEDRRLLVTNHDSLGYLADRYGLEVVGAVIPSASSLVETNPADLEALAEEIRATGAPAVFAETQGSAADAEALADEVGVPVVTLTTDTLGESGSGADTYVGLLRANADLIVDALSS